MAEAKQKTGAKPSKRVMDPKRKKRQIDTGEPSKEEIAVAKFVRFKCPTKKGNFGHGMGGEEVVYFVGSKAVDLLMESKWSASKSKKKDQALFSDRQAAVDYMQQLLMRNLFFRAKKLVPKIKEKATEAGDKKKGDQGKKAIEAKEELPKSPKAAKETEVKRRKKEKADKEDEEKEKKNDKENKKEKDEEPEKEKGNEKSPKARKVRLDFHQEQLFIDGPSIYVWKYDPTPLKTWLLGLGIVLGAGAFCLFPLWPIQVRVGVYYVSSTALGFIVCFFCFVVLRTLLFGLVWALTMGRHHFWLFPNLTEDCGVMESFKPVYTHKYVPPGSKLTDDKDRKKKDKKSDSEDEEEGEGEGEGGAGAVDDDARESKDDQAEDRGSESGSDNEGEQEKDGGESATHDDNDDSEEKSDGGSNENSTRTSTDEEPQTSQDKKSPKKRRRPIRRDDGQESSVNGDFEIVDSPKHD